MGRRQRQRGCVPLRRCRNAVSAVQSDRWEAAAGDAAGIPDDAGRERLEKLKKPELKTLTKALLNRRVRLLSCVKNQCAVNCEHGTARDGDDRPRMRVRL